MSHPAEYILPGARAVRAYAEKILTGVTQSQFARKPVVNGQLIDSNHPAFVYGHLSIYPSRLLKFLEMDDSAVALRDDYRKLFTFEAQCLDDPEGTIYPSMEEITSKFFDGMDHIYEILPNIPESAFDAKNEEERTRDRFPKRGSFVLYLLTAHPNGHLGQISTWRRCMGLGPA